MENLRRPFLIAAAVLLGIAFLAEAGRGLWVAPVSPAALQSARQVDAPTPGFGVPYVAQLDILLVFTVGLILLGVWMPERVQGKLQGIATLVVSFLVLLASIRAIIAALVALILMVTLLMSPIFGTIAYVSLYSRFDVSGAKFTLGMTMILKLVFAALLVLAHQRFLQNKSLVFVIVISLVSSFLVQFLIDFPPRFLASITDALGGLIVAIITALISIFYLVLAIVSVVRVLRVDRAAA